MAIAIAIVIAGFLIGGAIPSELRITVYHKKLPDVEEEAE